MGTIFFERDFSEITTENLQDINFDQCSGREIRKIMSDTSLYPTFLKTKVSKSVQEIMVEYETFSLEDLSTIFETYKDCPEEFNKTAWLYNNKTLPLDLITEYLHLFELQHIEIQRSLTPEFVREHYKEMDLPAFVERYLNNYGIDFFNTLLDIPDIVTYISSKYITWKLSSTVLKESVAIGLFAEHVDHEKIDDAYNFRVNANTLHEMFESGEHGYSSSSVVNYFNNNFSNVDVMWDDFVKIGIEKNIDTTLHGIIFTNLILPKIIKE